MLQQSAWLALFAMALQVVFTTAHLSAGAMRASGLDPDGLPIGFLSLCTGEGFAPIGRSDGSKGQANPSAPACPICSSAAVSGFTTASAVPHAPSVPVQVVEVVRPAPDLVVVRQSILPYGRTRGPPLQQHA